MATTKITYGRVTWTDIVHPTPTDVENLAEEYPFIHPLNLEDLLSPIERPKLDQDDQYLFVVLHFPVWDPQQRLTRGRNQRREQYAWSEHVAPLSRPPGMWTSYSATPRRGRSDHLSWRGSKRVTLPSSA